MDPLVTSLTVLFLVLGLLASGTWIFVALLATTIVSLMVLLGFPLDRVGAILKPVTFKSVTAWELAAVPLFVWMGEIINRTDLSARLFRGLTPWVSGLPGGLLHANVGGSVLFAAMSGSSVATTATIGRITIRELAARGYDSNLSVGSITVAGTIGIMIPPSITMIIYGLIAETSVVHLFAAGIVPGLLLGLAYSSYIGLRCALTPRLAPIRGELRPSWGDRLRGLLELAPAALLIVLILGGIYAGIATPSEAAALGVAGALMIALAGGGLTWRALYASAMSSVRITSMIGSAFAAAAVLSTTIGFLHLPQIVAQGIAALDLSPYGLLLILTVIYVLLGCVLDGISMILMTVPITLPLVLANGFDPVWFGVYLVLVVEMGMVTPPIGFNLFVLRGITGLPIERIALAAAPFFALMIVAAAVFTLFPELVLWLPGVLLD